MHQRRTTPPESSPTTVCGVTRSTDFERLKRKLRVAEQRWRQLPPGSQLANMLSVAITRRDETLLDWLLPACA